MIKKFAAGLDFSYPPTAFPNTKISKEAMQKHVETQTKNVEKSYLELVNSIKHEDGRFRFPSSSDYVKLYKSGKVTPLDITKKLLAAIESSNKTLNAWNQLNVDQILNSAGASAARYAKGLVSLILIFTICVKLFTPMINIYTTKVRNSGH